MRDKIDKPTKMFVILSMFYVSILLISNITAMKMTIIFGLVLPVSILLYPATWIVSDIMTEIYGIKLSLLAIRMNTAMNILMSLFFVVAIKMPHPAFWQAQQSFSTVLGQTPRIVAASIIAYYLGDWSNSAVLSILKRRMHGKKFFVRAIGSTAIGEIFDSILFFFLAFYGKVPVKVIWQMAIVGYLFKVLYEIVFYPVMNIIVKWWKKKEQIDVIDEPILKNYL